MTKKTATPLEEAERALNHSKSRLAGTESELAELTDRVEVARATVRTHEQRHQEDRLAGRPGDGTRVQAARDNLARLVQERADTEALRDRARAQVHAARDRLREQQASALWDRYVGAARQLDAKLEEAAVFARAMAEAYDEAQTVFGPASNPLPVAHFSPLLGADSRLTAWRAHAVAHGLLD